jgi:hypothetical protein
MSASFAGGIVNSRAFSCHHRHSRSKNGVAWLAYDPEIHAELQLRKPSGLNTLPRRMDCRIKSGNDE